LSGFAEELVNTASDAPATATAISSRISATSHSLELRSSQPRR
jgi:hypothetical protein